MAHDAFPAIPPEGTAEGEELDLARVKELTGLFLRAPRRHPWLAAATLLLTLAFGMTVATLWPRSYPCSVRILAQRNLVLPALGNPSRAVPREADSPTKNAADTIMQHDSIVALIKQLDLVDRWQSTRQPLLRFKDRLTGALSKRSDEERLLDMVGLLEKRLQVGTDDSSITISIEWPDRNLAFEIITLLQKNFLEARYDSNVAVIAEAIRILEERAKPQAAEVDAALADLTKIQAERRPLAVGLGAPLRRRAAVYGGPVGAATAHPASSAAVVAASGDAVEALEDVRRRIRLIKDDRERQLLQAQNQLADARATLGPLHPTVVALNGKIADLTGPAPELAGLSARERELVAQIAHASAPPAASSSASAAPHAGDAPGPRVAVAPAPDAPAADPAPLGAPVQDLRDDPQVALALSRLQGVSAKYSELLSRIEAANIELEVTRAAFKYQYTVVRPPELARMPSKPNTNLLLLLTVFGALALTILVPGLLDMGRGRFVEVWQLERQLGIPVLGRLRPPS